MAEEYAEVIRAFHLMWDAFPGMARLLNRRHTVVASNPVAQSMGFAPGVTCAKVAPPEIHRKCKMALALKTGKAQADCVIKGRIRGWQPVPGYPDLLVHFAIAVPPAEEGGAEKPEDDSGR